MRKCACGCGEDLPANASRQMLYKPGHRQRKYQRKRDAAVRKALAAVGGAVGVKMTASGAPRRRRRRSETRYRLVSRADLDNLGAIAEVEARGRAAAERMVDEDVVAVPALRS